MDLENREIVEIAIKKAKEYFAQKQLEDSSEIINKWVEEGIYPYKNLNDFNQIKKAEKQIFDILAVNVSSYLYKFDKQDKKSKKFTFQLLKQAIENNPESIQKIINEILDLGKDEQDTLANLLEKTTLSSIIKSAKIVESRLNFIQGLENLIFDRESKSILLERDQLHKILENETWLFSEDFSLANSEVRLEEVLAIHLKELGQREDLDNRSVVCPNGKHGRVDLMLSKSKRPREGYMAYLVIELKRPSRKITNEVLGQVERYALAVARDARFQKDKTKWTFIAVSNEMDEHAKRRANQRNSVEGRVFDDEEYNIEVWAMTWSEIFHRARTKLEFFSSQLNINISRASVATYLKEIHGQFIPKLEREKVK